MKLPKLINHVSSFQFYQVFRYGALIIISILFAKSHLSIGEIGNYETLMLISSAVSSFWVAGLMNSMLALYKHEENKSSFFFNSFLLILIFNSIVVLLMIAFKTNIQDLVQQKEIPYYNLLLIFIFLNTPSFLIEHILLLKKQSHAIIIYGIVIYTLQVIIVVAPIFFGYSIESSIYSLIIVSIIKLIILFYLLIKNSTFEIHGKAMNKHLQFAAPLMASALFSGSADYIDGIIVTKNFDSSTFAIFRYGARELPFTLLMANAMSVALVPVVATGLLENSLKEIKQRSTRLMHLLFPVTIVLLLVSKWLYPIVFNPKFQGSADVFNIFLMLIISRMIFPQTILIGLRKTRIIMMAAFIEMIINIAFSLILLQYFGLMGVAYGTIIAYFSEKLILLFYSYYVLKIKPKDYIPITILTAYSAILIICYILVEKFF